MSTVAACIARLRTQLERHRRRDLKEYPTRVIFIDPLLKALGWDITDPDEAELEYATIDGKSVDYGLKINREPVLFVEAKPMGDPLDDVRSITQVVSYAAIAGVEWCILTNGIAYRVYRSTEKAEAPDKLLYEISIDPKETEGMSVQQVAALFERFSKEAMAKGRLDEIGEQIFTTGKVRKALDILFTEPPGKLIRLIRSTIGDDTVKPAQIRMALKRLWAQTSEVEVVPADKPGTEPTKVRRKDYDEKHHTEGKPQEAVELFWTVDKFCRELDPTNVERKYLAKYVRYSYGKNIFCCVHLQKSGLRVWLKLDYSALEAPPDYARDVSNVGHWGVGDVELGIDSLDKVEDAKLLIRESFEKNRPK